MRTLRRQGGGSQRCGNHGKVKFRIAAHRRPTALACRVIHRPQQAQHRQRPSTHREFESYHSTAQHSKYKQVIDSHHAVMSTKCSSIYSFERRYQRFSGALPGPSDIIQRLPWPAFRAYFLTSSTQLGRVSKPPSPSRLPPPNQAAYFRLSCRHPSGTSNVTGKNCLIGRRWNSGVHPQQSPPSSGPVLCSFCCCWLWPQVSGTSAPAPELHVARCLVAAEEFVVRVLVAPQTRSGGSEATRTCVVHQQSIISQLGSFMRTPRNRTPSLGTKWTPLSSGSPWSERQHILAWRTRPAQRSGRARRTLGFFVRSVRLCRHCTA